MHAMQQQPQEVVDAFSLLMRGLLNSLSPDLKNRVDGEETIEKLRKIPEFTLLLLKATATESHGVTGTQGFCSPTSLAAAICLKNFINRDVRNDNSADGCNILRPEVRMRLHLEIVDAVVHSHPRIRCLKSNCVILNTFEKKFHH
jgi:hypothetical protein